MNADAMGSQPGAGAQAPSEDELRAAYEAELARISATDMIAQSAVSLLNIGAHRIGAPGGAANETPAGQDLEQARDAIDAARALLEILERRIPDELAPLRDALSRLQMAYATEQGRTPAAGAEQTPAGQAPPASTGPDVAQPGEPGTSEPPGEPGPGPAESSGRLWVPGR
jgi:hypothetical protein